MYMNNRIYDRTDSGWVVQGELTPQQQAARNAARSEKEAKELAKALVKELEVELPRAAAIKAAIPVGQKLRSIKFAMKIDRIFASMMSYQENGAILRKDIDRYDDAIVDAHGEVPRAVIEYVEEAFSELKHDRFSARARATRVGIELLAEDD